MQNRRLLEGMREVRITLECFHTGRGDEKLYVPVVRVRRRRKTKGKTKRAWRVYRFLQISTAVLMAAAVYMFLAPLAYMERGYMAYGGEYFAAAAAGIAVYGIWKGVFNREA